MAEVFRDAQGVPHIRATDVRDLAGAQGEVTARDRGWQIEVDRLRSGGRLSSLIGEAGVAWDVFACRARLDDTARRAFAALDAESRRFVGDYAAGVRRGMGLTGGDAAEFRALDAAFGDAVPLTPWEDHDPLGVLHVAHALFSPFPTMLWREHVAMTLGDEWIEVFAGDDGDETLPTSGSNAWALHGSRTESGMPLLAGDPHRLFELPGVYQQIRLACDEFDVVGLAFPGVPGAPHFAHTGNAAWGITNAIAHSVEVFDGERLVGGLFGLSFGRMFCGDSMYSAESGASSLALAALASRLRDWAWPIIDAQVPNAHTRSLGVQTWARDDYLRALAELRDQPADAGSWTARFGETAAATVVARLAD